MYVRSIPYDLTEKILFVNAEKSHKLHRIGKGEFVLRKLAVEVAMWHRENAALMRKVAIPSVRSARDIPRGWTRPYSSDEDCRDSL